MNKIKIVTDSTMDMSEETLLKYANEIAVVPLTVTINGETFLDRVQLIPADFIKMMRSAKELPKTSQPSPGAFLEVYNRLGTQGYDIISIHMTGKMSGTVRSAETAAQMANTSVTVIDSQFVSKALSFQVIEAAEMVKQGKSSEEIVKRLEAIQKNTRLYVMVDTLENLVKGGRIGKGKAFLGSLMNIKPIASLEGAEYHPVAKVRSYSQVIKYLVNQFIEDVKGTTIKRVGIAHAESFELAVKIKDRIIELTGFNDIEIDYTNSIVSTHTGPGAIALMYLFE
ncbi:MAG: DegV family protein [Bacillota bacterium]|jgi:DegV family protein with EDD domain|nr:DegV family protein [Bacillota bacterium]MDP4154856.1 DegV family protein [Bacillota bacterium]